MGKPIFEINEAGGKCYRIWANGNVEGFDAEGAMVLNGIIPALNYLAGLAINAGGDAAVKAKAFLQEDGLLREEISPTLQLMSMSDEPFHLTHMLMIQMENDAIGDGNSSEEFAMALRCYADMVLTGKAGCRAFEMLSNARGTRMTVIAGTGNVAQHQLEGT